MNFKYETKTVVNKPRHYPANELAGLFLQLNQAKRAKTFTEKQLGIIRRIGEIVGFELSGNSG